MSLLIGAVVSAVFSIYRHDDLSGFIARALFVLAFQLFVRVFCRAVRTAFSLIAPSFSKE